MGEGLKGTTKGRVHPVFKDRLTELQVAAVNAAQSFQGIGQRTWDIPSGLQASDIFDIANLHQTAFDRTPINDNYVDCVSDADSAGTVGDVISLKFQMDYNAAEERAFRARHSSTVRCLVHGMSRREFLGSGPTFDAVEKQAADSIAAGAL